MARTKKRKKSDLSTPYFGEIEEMAVVTFMTSDDQIDRTKIYNEFLRAPLNTMIESIIRRYKLYPKDMEFNEIHSDTLSFLMTKFSRFNPDENKKAYSYFGTIVKNYLLGKLIKKDKEIKQFSSYEDMYETIDENEEYSYRIDEPDQDIDGLFLELIEKISEKLITDTKLNDNELKVGEALIELLSDWETILGDNVGGSGKYNKNRILSFIREYTLLSTKDIRISMKKFKELYFITKNYRIEEGLF